MSNSILILGAAGSGKTSSISSLDSKKTYIINIRGKRMPFKNSYSVGKNMFIPKNQNACTPEVLNELARVSNTMPHIETLIIDDFYFLMALELLARSVSKEKDSFAKFREIGKNTYDVLNKAENLRKGLDVFVIETTELKDDIAGDAKYLPKTVGKLLDQNIDIYSMFTIALHARVQKDKDGNPKYAFLTQEDGLYAARSDRELFVNKKYIPSSLQFVKDAMRESEINFENKFEEELEKLEAKSSKAVI